MRNELRISLTIQNITVVMLDFSNMHVSNYGNVHSRVNLVSMLKDHVTLLNFLNLCGFRYPFVIFLMCRLTIVKIGDTTNILYKPRFHADRSHGVINPTDTSCLPFPIDFRVIYYFTCIKRALIRNSLWQPRFHAGILV